MPCPKCCHWIQISLLSMLLSLRLTTQRASVTVVCCRKHNETSTRRSRISEVGIINRSSRRTQPRLSRHPKALRSISRNSSFSFVSRNYRLRSCISASRSSFTFFGTFFLNSGVYRLFGIPFIVVNTLFAK